MNKLLTILLLFSLNVSGQSTTISANNYAHGTIQSTTMHVPEYYQILPPSYIKSDTNISSFFAYDFDSNGVHHPKIIDSNYHYKNKAGEIIDSVAYVIYQDGFTERKYAYVAPVINYKIIYKMVVGKKIFTDCCAALTPFGEASYVNDVNQWVNSNNNVLIYRYSGLLDISGAMIYEGDYLKDKAGNLHKVTFGNGCFRYGTWDNKRHQLDSILYRGSILKDSLHLR